jgi:SpoVK/Ycf46/Vps4 family AAA+-type ATPase
LKLDAARLYDKYVGESERNLREVLRLAESLAPIVLWIDEIEKGLAVGGDDASGATSRRMLGTLLTWMSEPRADIFLVATSNDLSALPVELQRKGRFDEVFFVDLPTPRERAAIFGTQLSGRRQSREHFDLRVLVSETNGFSGAEIEQVVVAGLLRALHARRVADTAALLDEIAATVPLSRSRADEIAAIRARARDFVPASEG